MNIPVDDFSIPVRRHPRRRHLALVATEAGVEVRAPHHCPRHLIEAFVAARRDWILAACAQGARRRFYLWGEVQPRGLTAQQAREALTPWLMERLAYWQAEMGVCPGQVRIRSLRSRWGSCSSRGNLSFALSLVQLPQAVADYVVVHELAHLREMNHGPAFWALVARHLPDYAERRRMLRKWSRRIALL